MSAFRSFAEFVASLRAQLGVAAAVGWPDPRRDADEDWPEGMWEDQGLPMGLRGYGVGPSYTGRLGDVPPLFCEPRGTEALRRELFDD
jgi:hypothetical protein